MPFPSAPQTSDERSLAAGPVVAVTDYMRAVSDQIRQWVPGRYRTLGTDGYGRSDFRRALRTKVADAVRADGRAKLYDALTEYFQLDFDAAEKYVDEYEELCKVDLGESVGEERVRRQQEERRRRANFLCLVGKGREAQNRLTDAFQRYLELGETARRDELIQVVDEPAVKAAPDVWSQGRIAAMIANATDAKQSKAVEDRIAIDQWQSQCASGELTEVFACGTAAVITPVGRVKGKSAEWLVGDGTPGPVTMRLREELIGIQYGRLPDPFTWIHKVC